MTSIALFHSALGVRPGVVDAADRLRAAGHVVTVVDQYDGRVFDDQESAGRYVEEVGFPALMGRALAAVTDLPDGFVAAGFSNGAGMAEFVATQRRCSGVLLFSGALPLAMLGVEAWPAGTAVQLHYGDADPRREQEWVDAFTHDVQASGARFEAYDYPTSGHLFTDPSLPDEYDSDAATLLWKRATAFLAELPGPAAKGQGAS